MALTIEACGAAILAGGQSRRMGACKPLLRMDGETMIGRLAGQMESFPELWISANDPKVAQGLPGRLVRDRCPGLGPLAGLQAVLEQSGRPYVLCVACDMPGFCRELAHAMLAEFPPEADALICADSTGRRHPLCGIYARSVLPVLTRRLKAGDLRMQGLLEEIHTRTFSIAGRFPDRVLWNINTPEEFRRLREKGTAP